MCVASSKLAFINTDKYIRENESVETAYTINLLSNRTTKIQVQVILTFHILRSLVCASAYALS